MPAINNLEKEQRRQLIADVLLDFITREGKAPSFMELLTLTGLDERRLKQALKTLNFNPETHVLRLLTDSVIMAVYKNATEAGNPASQKLWFQLMENRTDKVLPPDPKKDPEGRVFITMLPPDPMPDYSAKDADFVELSHSDPAALPDGSANPDFPVTRYPAALPRYSAERCLDSDRYSDALPD